MSFNFSAATSFKLDQSENAPVSKNAAVGYTAALNDMLSSRAPRRRLRLNDTTIAVFWSRSEIGQDDFAPLLADILDGPETIESCCAAPRAGRPAPIDSPDRFYSLVLSGAQGRAAVRDWFESSVADISRRVVEHFQDLDLIYPYDDAPHPRLDALLRAVVLKGETKNIAPNLAAEF
ncbi:MAG: type I-C CRISPR-associated protein Cas8c/Csd1, partial [Deltaproteobacteria bacterium]|nr:type I-C CRISPR-associated protein Cas8c/Csd1 [Deltaproteobacteria bacterium]